MRPSHLGVFSFLSLTLVALGCGGARPPQLTEVEGVVLLDNEPLPQASVTFMPELKGFGAEYNSQAITDKDGKFVLVCRKTGDPGAVIGTHRVVVTEFTPAQFRGITEEIQLKADEYFDTLKNRPIPEVYTSIGKTPLRIEITAEQKQYTLVLNRPPSD
jgi:hypothetical protein